MGSRGRILNETVFPTMPAITFPHIKKPMPPDQKNKLLAMHRAGRVNAGIYVAIVLAIYLILLTILLCRYSRKHRSSEEGRSTCCGFEDDSYGPLSWIMSLSSCFDKVPLHNRGTCHRRSTIEEPRPNPIENIELINKITIGVSNTTVKHDVEDEGKQVQV